MPDTSRDVDLAWLIERRNAAGAPIHESSKSPCVALKTQAEAKVQRERGSAEVENQAHSLYYPETVRPERSRVVRIHVNAASTNPAEQLGEAKSSQAVRATVRWTPMPRPLP